MMKFFRALGELLSLLAAHLRQRKHKKRERVYEEAENDPAEHFVNKFGGVRPDDTTKTSNTRAERESD